MVFRIINFRPFREFRTHFIFFCIRLIREIRTVFFRPIRPIRTELFISGTKLQNFSDISKLFVMLYSIFSKHFHPITFISTTYTFRLSFRNLSKIAQSDADSTLSVDPESNSGNCQLSFGNCPLTCSDTDYATAELIGNKLILHMAEAYQLIKGTDTITRPAVKPLDQKQILLSLLPEEFGHAILVREASAQGIPSRTVERWNENWQQQGLVFRVKYDCYKKIA